MSGHSTAKVAFRSSSQPQRRQNTSCDPCRRSKRRCFFPLDGLDNLNDPCAHCRRLGHACTFNFAASQQNLRRKRQRRNPPSPDRKGDHDTSPHNESFDLPMGLREDTSRTGSVDAQDDFAAWLNFDVEQSFSDNVTLPLTDVVNASEYTASCLGLTETPARWNERQLALLPDRSRGMQSSQYSADDIIGSSIRSPVRLLNSKMDAMMLDERSIRIFDTIVTGSANRFLDYECNLYATGTPYQIENCRSESSQGSSPANLKALRDEPATESAIASPQSAKLSLIPTQDSREVPTRALVPPRDDDFKMTLLGCALFLDHFGDLYGNRLSPTDRKKSDAALKSTFRAFSFQWLSNDKTRGRQTARSTSLDVYTDAWHRARSSLNDTHSVRSFRVVFASFMFNGIATPISARPNSTAHEFLDTALERLGELDGLVKQYCTTLGPFSKYAALLEASLSIVCWCGYLRGTGAALFGDHPCKLPYTLVHSNSDDLTPNYSIYRNLEDLDLNIPAICRKASAEAFCIWRQMINVKSTLPRAPNPNFLSYFRSTRVNHQYAGRYWKRLPVSLMAFWYLGVLIFAEILQPLRTTAIPDLSSKMKTCRRDATSSMADIIECVLQLPVEEAFNLQNGLSADVPLIAYHVTPSLMVTALEKAVEHIIDMQTSYNHNEEPVGTSWDSREETWTRQIDYLMKGLLSLEVTVGGSQTAGVAFQSLMRKHGDIISECWTSDFET
ncbi:hypothetical protein N7476_005696 [Penicillium atrosanguineum]|uniref:Zn(2)-C6 fungal-type domain-containing protein n=1 Tax=Penicillium atrosanguineum TaxID=1132637 RepID=A0A9W9PVZ2_9EURO|nr:hypothetical protein N7476_005696 [Penicillium atrosanguineum]